VQVGAQTATTTSSETTITVSVRDEKQPVKEIKLFVNGRLLGKDELSRARGSNVAAGRTGLAVSGGAKDVRFEIPIALEPGANYIEARATNAYEVFNDIKDLRNAVTVTWQTTRKAALPNLWLLAVGVNDYDTIRPTLDYCVNDARGIVAAFEAQEGRRYAKVHTRLVADGAGIEPTAKNITDNFAWLEQAGPRDVIVLFLAGHGVTVGNNFYFLPKDAALHKETVIDMTKAVSDKDLLSVLDAPGNRLVFVDACRSGGMDGNLMTRALMGSGGLVFTAGAGSELSNELDALGHGVFTYALMEGLRGAWTPERREVRMLPMSVSVGKFVSEEVRKRGRPSQHPKLYYEGYPDLTIAVKE
jgi:hypothetical protein